MWEGCLVGGDEFVAGGEDGDARLAGDGELGGADGGGETEVGGVEDGAGAEEWGACGTVGGLAVDELAGVRAG